MEYSNEKQNTFYFVAIVFLFAIGAALLVFKNYSEYYQDQIDISNAISATTVVKPQPAKAATPTSTPVNQLQNNQTSSTVGWRTYTNSQYGFELRFPPHWLNMKVESDGLSFDLANSDTKKYNFLCGIKVFSQMEWNKLQSSGDPNSANSLGARNGDVYTYECIGDDYGYIGFEDYNQNIRKNNFMVGYNLDGLGPIWEFNNLVVPTFKFTK